MKRYSLTSLAFEGEVIFDFDDADLLVRYDTTGASLSEQQQLWILKNMPRELSEVQHVLGNSGTAKLTEIVQEVTFDLFWNRYNEKERSSKKRTLQKWNRMSQTDRVKAYRFIPKYEMSLRNGIEKKYAETYLNAELWNN